MDSLDDIIAALLLIALYISWGGLAALATRGIFVDYLTPKWTFKIVADGIQRLYGRIGGWTTVAIMVAFLVAVIVLNIRDALANLASEIPLPSVRY